VFGCPITKTIVEIEDSVLITPAVSVQPPGSIRPPARPHPRRIQPLVTARCATAGIPYTTTTLWQSYAVVVRHLNSVGLKGSDLLLCPLVAARRALPTTSARSVPAHPTPVRR